MLFGFLKLMGIVYFSKGGRSWAEGHHQLGELGQDQDLRGGRGRINGERAAGWWKRQKGGGEQETGSTRLHSHKPDISLHSRHTS